MGCHFLLHEVFPTQGSNPRLLCLLHWQADSLPLCILGSCPVLHHSPNTKIRVLLDYIKEHFSALTGSLFYICLILVILSHRHVKTNKCREEPSLNFPYGPKDKSSERNSIVLNTLPKSFINQRVLTLVIGGETRICYNTQTTLSQIVISSVQFSSVVQSFPTH